LKVWIMNMESGSVANKLEELVVVSQLSAATCFY